MNLTTVAHHLSLLDLPPVLAGALESGRCTSPRTLHELSKLSEQQPELVQTLVEGQGAITRDVVASLKAEVPAPKTRAAPAARRLAQAVAACERLERLLVRIAADDVSSADFAALRERVAALLGRLSQGSDGQTPGA